MLTDKTEEWTRDRAKREEERPQIIYMIEGDGDYCREPATGLDASATHEQVCEWARDFFNNVADRHAKKYVVAFRVEWW